MEQLMGRKMKLFLLALLITLLIGGCSRLTKDNYDKLEMGMEYSKVTALLGKPDNCSDSLSVKSCIWGNEARNIKVNFLSDKVVVFSATGIK